MTIPITNEQHEDSKDEQRDQSNKSLYKLLSIERSEIRLLTVSPGSGCELLRCRLHQAFLDDTPRPTYETISYCWSDPSLQAPIILNGNKTSIPASAERSLRRMRLPDRERILWLDAVCINQNDSVERGTQVALMSQIYAQTQLNLIWLGEDDGSTPDALRAIRLILQDAKEETNNLESFSDRIWSKQGVYQFSKTGISTNVSFDSLLRFYARPWFQRLWVSGLTNAVQSAS